MRNTRKIIVALLVVFTLLMSMTAIFASAASTPEKLYLTPNANWKVDNARFAAYFFGNGEKWVSMTYNSDLGVYEVDVPAGYPSVIFCRMNPNAAANNWNNKWNQTADLTVPTNGTNHYTVKEGTWDKGGGTWGTLIIDSGECSHANVTTEEASATCTTDGYKKVFCTDCEQYTVNESYPALGHTYSNGTDNECNVCSAAATWTVAGSGAHMGTEWDTGNIANDMTLVDGKYVKVYENVAAGSYALKCVRDHDWGTAYPSADKAYTVATSGSTVTVTLSGTTVTVDVVVPHVHVWSDATCTELSKCECGETQGELADHNYVDGACSACGAAAPCEHEFEENVFWHPELVAADCCHTGVAVFECTKCDYYYTQETPVDSEAHAFWGDREVITAADCATKTNGLEKVACANGCGQFTENEISYYEAHNWDVQKETSATCTEGGEYYAVCTICNEIESYSNPANGHYNYFVTCGQTGECMECGAEFTADPHTVNPCEGGMCFNCYEMFEALGHNFVEGVCSVCGAEDPDYVPSTLPIVNISDLAAGTTDGGELIAGTGISASAGLSIDANSKSVDGFDFTLRLKLGGTMKIEDGVVKAGIEIKTNGAAKIIVYAMSSSSSDSTRTLQLASLVDGAFVKLAETAGVDGSTLMKYELSVEEAGTYYLGSTKSGINVYYIAVEAVEAPAHVNTLVVGDNNKIVISGETLNAYGFPIEWVTFYAEEKANYAFAGEGATIAIFDLEGNLLCNYTGAADLEAGYYLICVGGYFAGEYNVAVTKTAIEEPVAPQYNWWVSDGSLYTVEGNNIKYNGAGNTYACVGCDVTELAAGNNTFTITITNNGSATAKVRVDLQATVQVGNHKVVNVSAVGGDVWTDSEWGGSHVHVAPGESVTLVITYDETTERGAVKDLIIFADSGRGDEAVYSADITVSGMAFSKIVDYTNTLVVGENDVTIGHKAVDNGYGYLMETVIFTADEKAHYKFAGEGVTVLVYDMAFNNLCAFTGEADLDAGMYIICFAANTIGTTGEYTISVTKSEIIDTPTPELPEIVLGDNAVVIDGTQTNLVGNAIAWYTFTPEVAGAYQFTSADLTVYILTSKNMADAGAYVGANGIADLEAGVKYFILVGKDGVTGEFAVNVAAYEGEKPHVNTMVVGDNKYIISDALLETGYEFLAIEITEPGTYVFTGGVPMTVFFWTVPGTVDTASPYILNVDSATLEFLNSFEVTLSEAGLYWIGFRYDNVGDFREFDINIALKPAHEHNFVEGKCECGAEDPNYTAPEQPDVDEQPEVETPDETPDETPADPQPEVKLNFFQKIWKAIMDFFKKLFGKKD